jgi:hypothetical protein
VPAIHQCLPEVARAVIELLDRIEHAMPGFRRDLIHTTGHARNGSDGNARQLRDLMQRCGTLGRHLRPFRKRLQDLCDKLSMVVQNAQDGVFTDAHMLQRAPVTSNE